MSHTDSTILQAALQPSATEGSQATPVALPVGEVVSAAERFLEVCNHPAIRGAAIAWDIPLYEAAAALKDAIERTREEQPDCIFCGVAGHFSMDCRAFTPTGKQP